MQLAVVLYMINVYLLRKLRQPIRQWVHPINQNREETSVRNRIGRREYPERVFSYFKMNPETFDFILNSIEHKVQRCNTNMRVAIDPV